MTAPGLDQTSDAPTREPGALPRWLQVVMGVLLSAFLLPCLAGALMMALLPNDKAPVMAPVAGILMALLSFWLFRLCFRLVSGRRASGGLMSPRTLKAIAWLLLLLPLAGLLTGYFAAHTQNALLQTAAYVSAFFGLRSLARRRSVQGKRLDDSVPSSTLEGH